MPQLGQWCHLHKSLTAMYWLALGALTTDMIPRGVSYMYL
jgi:hypothetical protein